MIPISCKTDAKVYYTDEDGIKYTFRAMSGILENEFLDLTDVKVRKDEDFRDFNKRNQEFFDKVVVAVDLAGNGKVTTDTLSKFFSAIERGKILGSYWYRASDITAEEKKS